MKKILFMLNSMQPSGGIERVVATLTDKLSATVDLEILVKDAPISFYPLNPLIRVKSLNVAIKLNMKSRASRVWDMFVAVYKSSQKLRSYLRTYQYDAFYATHPVNVLEYFLAGGDLSKMIISEHGSKDNYNFIYKIIKYFLYKKCKCYVIPTTLDTKRYLDEKYPAVYIQHFKPNLIYLKDESNKSKVVLNIGRLTQDKQQHILINIWSSIKKKHPTHMGWKLKIVGGGELEYALIEKIKKYDLLDSVEILPPSQQVEKYYAEASVFALTSRSEGFGMVLLEALSFALPCISFNCESGPRDIISNGYSGYLIDLNDEEMFEMRLLELMSNKEKLQNMSKQALMSSLKWDDDVILSKWQEVLK